MKTTMGVLILTMVVTGCTTFQPKAPATTIEFRAGETIPAPGLTEMTVMGTERKVYLHDGVLLTNEDIKSVSAKAGQFGPQIEIIFTDEGRRKLAKATAANLNKPLGIVVDGKLLSAPIVKDKISGGRAIIIGSFSFEEAERIAQGIVTK